MMVKDDEEYMLLKEAVIDGIFNVEGMEVAKINNEYLEDEDSLAFGRIAFMGYEYVLMPLTDDEYAKAAKKYNELMEAFI